MADTHYSIVIERWAKDDEDEDNPNKVTAQTVTVLADITKLGTIWMPTCLFPACPKSGVPMGSEDPATALQNLLAHLEFDHGEQGLN